MADVVNLDALIPREDFIAPPDDNSGAGESGKPSASATDLTRGESFFATLRKPDFQRETAAWTPTAVCDFIEAFVSNDLIPAVICWQSPARLTFIIDGAHRLSAIIAWIMDDYGAGNESTRFYGKIPDEQERTHIKTRELVSKRVGSYVQWRTETMNPGSFPELRQKVRALAHAKVPLLWVPGNDATKAEKAFFTINQSAVEIDATELKILNARSKPNAVAARSIVRNATGTKYWDSFSGEGQKTVIETAKAKLKAMKNLGPAAVEHMLDLLTLKFEHWHYEQEHRLFVQLNDKDDKSGLYFFDFGGNPEIKLSEIILGAYSEISPEQIKRTLGRREADVKTHKARLAFRTFEVVAQRNQDLWRPTRKRVTLREPSFEALVEHALKAEFPKS
ncbi:DUF262 domain-containing protein [Bradyrhizobium sp. AUGA SZCCT0182]|uniref:DUF262 domain-containing protein n=1 Tax=Bradyrhizobium sp. AUGA SZCCT0182 TaxID=2807667 RepID=UPI001BA50AB5|nr:DUF262 domain-containing protein [Bradyrhizobium sp. AUGA SZCCT0182]MBR1236671.1 DUF262 domain-containing protein [Bradyrhizobium sp. AUGA SZCCT0182]